jgi:hypothetical protein
MIQYLNFEALSNPGSSVGADASGLSLLSGMGLGYGILSLTLILSTPTTTVPVTPINEVPTVKEDVIDSLGGDGVDRMGEESEEDLKAVILGVSGVVLELEFVLYYLLSDVIDFGDHHRLHLYCFAMVTVMRALASV